jgi:acetylornithine/N-succinyldiaminopimelate aminotransferase
MADELGVGPVSGRGLLLALELPQPGQALAVAEALRRGADGRGPGVLVNAVRPTRLRLVPALTITADEVALAVQRLRQALGLAGPAATTAS